MFRFIFKKELKKMEEEMVKVLEQKVFDMEEVLERKALDLEQRVLLYTLGISPSKGEIRDHNTDKCDCSKDDVQIENSIS